MANWNHRHRSRYGSDGGSSLALDLAQLRDYWRCARVLLRLTLLNWRSLPLGEWVWTRVSPSVPARYPVNQPRIRPTLRSTHPTAPPETHARPQVAPSPWGWLPELALTSAVAVLIQAFATNAGRHSAHAADLLFWIGVIVLYAPIAARLLMASPLRRERIGLVLMLTSSLYLFKMLNYPLEFRYIDELLHVRSATDLAASGHLFQPNPLLPVSPYYPGLEIVTNAVSGISGLSLFGAGALVVGSASLLWLLALYLFFELACRDARLAGIATLVYLANPSLLGDMWFSYESLALPMAVLVVFLILRRIANPPEHHRALDVCVIVCLAAVDISHHATSYLLEAFLLLWTVIWFTHFIRGRPHRLRWRGLMRQLELGSGPAIPALSGAVLLVIWSLCTHNIAWGYLTGQVGDGVQELLAVLTAHQKVRQLFHDGSGTVEPLWEQLFAFIGQSLIVLGLPFGLYSVWRRYRASVIALVLALVALAYPLSQLAHFVPAGEAVVGRLPEFLYIGLGFVLTIGPLNFLLRAHYRLPNWMAWPRLSWLIVRLRLAPAIERLTAWLTIWLEWWRQRPTQWRQATVFALLLTIFIGGMVIDTSPIWSRLPGPFLVAAADRSFGPEGIDAAQWTESNLGSNNRVATDRSDSYLMGAYGDQWLVAPQTAGVDISQLFYSTTYTQIDQRIVTRGRIRLIVVDRRVARGLPHMGFYYSSSEPNAFYHTTPVDPVALAKFNGLVGADRLYDSGDIIIYDVSSLAPLPTPAPRTTDIGQVFARSLRTIKPHPPVVTPTPPTCKPEFDETPASEATEPAYCA